MKINDKTKYVEGYFKIQAFDTEGKEIYHFEKKNKVMDSVANFFSRIVAKKEDFYSPPLVAQDLEMITFALGTDGVDSAGNPKEFLSSRNRLHAEDNFWNDGVSYNDGDMKKYVYQVTFEQPPQEDQEVDLVTQNEGATFPVDQNLLPLRYRDVIIGVDSTKLTGTVEYHNNVIKFKFTLGQFAGNGCPTWNLAPTFSEAALYMRRGNTTLGDHLGSLFSMRTFPALPKTDACSIKIEWVIDFNTVGDSC
jgi:hypothetical protein